MLNLRDMIEILKANFEALGIEATIEEYTHCENGRKCISLNVGYDTDFCWYEDTGEVVV